MFKQEYVKYGRDSEYIILCRTCDRVFYKNTLEEHAKSLGFTWRQIQNNYRLILERGYADSSPPLWYIKACKHWLETLSDRLILNDGHSINAFVKHIFTSGEQIDYFNSDLVFDFSKDWWNNFLREPPNKRNKTSMLRELEYLEETLK